MTKITSVAKLKTSGFVRVNGSLPSLRFGYFSASTPLELEVGKNFSKFAPQDLCSRCLNKSILCSPHILTSSHTCGFILPQEVQW